MADLTAGDIRLERTCYACPEQYDAYGPDGRKVAYLRLRHGRLTVDMPHAGGQTVYSAERAGDGIFADGERAPRCDGDSARIWATCQLLSSDPDPGRRVPVRVPALAQDGKGD
jgi:hypothetical protein